MFNVGQSTSKSIKNKFHHGGRDPWKDCKVEFKAHIYALSELFLYSNKIRSCTSGMLPADDRFQKTPSRYEIEEADAEINKYMYLIINV